MNKATAARWVRMASVALLISLICGCSPSEPPKGEYAQETDPTISAEKETKGEFVYDPTLDQWAIEPHWEDQAFNGLCFAMTGARSRGLDMDALIDLVGEMNVEAQRHWIHATSVLSDPNTPNETQVARH